MLQNSLVFFFTIEVGATFFVFNSTIILFMMRLTCRIFCSFYINYKFNFPGHNSSRNLSWFSSLKSNHMVTAELYSRIKSVELWGFLYWIVQSPNILVNANWTLSKVFKCTFPWSPSLKVELYTRYTAHVLLASCSHWISNNGSSPQYIHVSFCSS